MEFNKGDKVKVLRYSRIRTIFAGAEVTPGETTTYPGGWMATVTNIFEGMGEDIIEVRQDGYKQLGKGYQEFCPHELKLIEKS